MNRHSFGTHKDRRRIITTLTIVTMCLLICLGRALAGSAPGTGMVGSIHDMNMFNFVFKDPNQRVCIFCHTPHNANPAAGALWNLTIDPTIISLSPYQWVAPTNQDILFNADPLVGPSRLCMTCHDGVIAMDSQGDTMVSRFPQDVISTNLSTTHPIGFSYDSAMKSRGPAELADKSLSLATAVTVSNSAGVYNQVSRNSSLRIVDVLYQGTYVTCMTCHDVHNDQNVLPDPGDNYNYLLWAKEEQSMICLSCHLK
jgi:hypothetical protein